uniref:CSON011043 protein n=1 Tax=Culicoides sonorensis TaxID=179676 RepID=A0A336M3E9_CULSO
MLRDCEKFRQIIVNLERETAATSVDVINEITTTRLDTNSTASLNSSELIGFTSTENYNAQKSDITLNGIIENEVTVCLTWTRLGMVLLFSLLIIVTIIGNTLVILSVMTTRRLRTVTNCFVMSLAMADWLVGVTVMPPAVFLYIVGTWRLGWILCDIWISLDVLLCTASILSLCAISVDRYLAVTQPITYSKKRRSKRLACFMILIVWIIALAITCPPYFGWYDSKKRFSSDMFNCHYNQNKGYVVFSAMGSFFIPMTVMLYVYSKIFYVLMSRQNRMSKTEVSERTYEIEPENYTSEAETSAASPRLLAKSSNSTSNFASSQLEKDNSHHTLYELVDLNKSRPSIRSLPNSTKYSCNPLKPYHSVQFTQSQLSINDSCLSTSRFKIHSHGNRIPIRISSLRRETKTAQTLSMVVGGFVICWLPFFICYLLMPFVKAGTISEDLMSFLTWLGWLNSAINPFIYAFYNTDFRIAFWRLTCKKFYNKSRQDLSYLKN